MSKDLDVSIKIPYLYTIKETHTTKTSTIMTHTEFQIGQTVHAVQMSSDSFYLEVKGTVTGFRNGFVLIDATDVKCRFTKQWAKHPGTCSTSAKIQNVKSI